MVERSSVVDFVYVEKSVGMKFQRGDQEMQKRAREENKSRLNELQKEVNTLAAEYHTSLLTISNSLKSEGVMSKFLNLLVKDDYSIAFASIEEGYQLYQDGCSGYDTYPTYRASDVTDDNVGVAGYVLVSEEPKVVVRFERIPDLKILSSLCRAINGPYEDEEIEDDIIIEEDSSHEE